MKVALPLVALLSTLALLPVAAAWEPAAVPACVNYVYVADYQWHYLCVDPKDTSCPVYLVVSNDAGRTFGPKDCLAGVPAVSSIDPLAPACYQYGYGMDYQSYVCHDLRAPSCQVYTITTGAPGAEPHCLVDAQAGCILFAQDLDYSHYLCTDPQDRRCPVYFLTTGGSQPHKMCVGLA